MYEFFFLACVFAKNHDKRKTKYLNAFALIPSAVLDLIEMKGLIHPPGNYDTETDMKVSPFVFLFALKTNVLTQIPP
jgi:hypothetical protein